MKIPIELPASVASVVQQHAEGAAEPEARSVAGAVVALILEKLADGVSPASVRGGYVYPGGAILRVLPTGIAVEDLTVDVVRDATLALLAANYSAATVSKQHLGLVRQVLARAGVRDVVTEVRRRLGHALKARSLPPPPFTHDELRSIFERIASYRSEHFLPARWHHLAILRLAGYRAVRALELARVRIEHDVDLAGATLTIRQAKDAGHPRLIDLSPILCEDVRTLCEGRAHGLLVRGGARSIGVAVETWQSRLGEPRLNMRHLRRSCASALDAQGAPIAVIREVLGHQRTSTQTLRYLGATRRRLRLELASLDGHGSPPTPDP